MDCRVASMVSSSNPVVDAVSSSRSALAKCLLRPTPPKTSIPRVSTYARELGAAVATLGSSAALLDVKDTVVAAGGLDDPSHVGPGVVAAKLRVSAALSPTGRTLSKKCQQ